MDHSIIYLIHILLGGPLMMYAGYKGKELSDEHGTEDTSNLFLLLMTVGIVVILYHGYKYAKMKELM